MKFAMIGQDIPMLLPGMLADLLFAGKEAAQVAVHEGNPAMQGVLKRYAEAVIRRSGLAASILVDADRDAVLRDADCVIYAGDMMPSSRFAMDRDALKSPNDEDPGMSDQARVNGGIGGLMHTLRAGELVLGLCDDMQRLCPDALVIDLGQPIARTVEMFAARGFRCYGLGRSPLRGANGIDAICRKLKRDEKQTAAVTVGLPGFAFVAELTDTKTGTDLLPLLTDAVDDGALGRLAQRWLDWYGAVAVGDVTDHAEFLPAQPDYIPQEEPDFGETVEQRKERILHMNTVGDKGASSQEGAMAQVTLLSKVPPVRPIRLALALLRGEDAVIPAVARRNNGELPQLDDIVVVECPLVLQKGTPYRNGYRVTEALAEILGEVGEANHLAAMAAAGDRSALREYVEMDPALAGLDRLYCQDVVDKLVELHSDVLHRL